VLPKQTLPRTGCEVVTLDGQRVARVASAGSNGGNLVHELAQPLDPKAQRSWRCRPDRAIDDADLQRKATDEAALKLCVLMDAPLDGMPFMERQQLRLAGGPEPARGRRAAGVRGAGHRPGPAAAGLCAVVSRTRACRHRLR
jgi:hypothetical protein